MEVRPPARLTYLRARRPPGRYDSRMRRLSLGTLLIGLNVGLGVLAVVGVVAAGSSLLRRLADEQAIARVRLAGSTARLAVELEAGRLQTAGHLLAERPDLVRAVSQRDPASAGASLAELRGATGLTACAVLLDGNVFASSGGVDWKTIVPAPGSTRAWGLGPAGPGGGLVLAAFARLGSEPRALVATARMLDAAFAHDIAAQAGMPVDIVPAIEALGAESDRAATFLSANLTERFHPVHARHRIVKQHKIGMIRFEEFDGGIAAFDAVDRCGNGLEAKLEQ